MRKRAAILLAAALFVALGSLTEARAANVATVAKSRQATTLQRLLGGGIDRVLKVIGAFDAVTPVGAAPATIIDEPDPAGRDGTGKDERKDNEKTDEQNLDKEKVTPGTNNQDSDLG
jgi:hypothetical protein